MPYDQLRLERYAMHAEKMSQDSPPLSGGIDPVTVGGALGFSREDSLELAAHLHESGWARLKIKPEGPRLTMTINGFKEVAKLRRPRWWRWLNDNPAVTAAIVSGAFLLAAKILELLLSRPG
jgi:hypothetical protein